MSIKLRIDANRRCDNISDVYVDHLEGTRIVLVTNRWLWFGTLINMNASIISWDNYMKFESTEEAEAYLSKTFDAWLKIKDQQITLVQL